MAAVDQPWWKSAKVMVFLLVFLVVQISLLLLVLFGKLEVTAGSVSAYLYAVAGLASSLFFSRALGSLRFFKKE
jgi:maltodextrin utilization protein YvdJ